MSDYEQLVRQERLRALHAWQVHYNMTPREDSKLTRMYVEGEVPFPPDVVARELLATDYIYKTTLYGEVIEDFLRRVASRLREEVPGLSWSATWDVVRFYGPIALKLLCLSTSGTRIPNRMPDGL